MTILYCLAGTFNSGGMERIVIDKANWFVSNGHNVVIVTTEQNNRPNFFPIDERVRRIDLNIMYSETNKDNVVKKFFRRNKKNRLHKRYLKNVLNVEKPDVVISTCGNELFFLPDIKDGSKKEAEIHFSRWFRIQFNRNGIWKLIDKYLTRYDKIRLSKFDAFVCLTEEDKRNWGNLDNLYVIPNFIEPVSNTLASLTQKCFIAVGRLSYQKGYDRMIEAWRIVNKEYSDWKLEIYGGGELYDDLCAMINGYGLSKSIIINRPVSNIHDKYLTSSGLLLSSHYEGLPMVLLEAMSCGLPVVSFNCQCGPADVIENGINGFLVEDGDVSVFADCIKQLIENEKMRSDMGLNAYEISRRFNKEVVMNCWLRLLLGLVR